MADDLEARLSAALHAYGDLVEEPDAELPRPVPVGVAPRPAERRWRGPALVAAAVVVVAGGGGWWAVGDNGGREVVAGSSRGAEPSAEGAAGTSAPVPAGAAADGNSQTYDSAAAVPGAGLPADPQVGVPYAVSLLTHCGVYGADVGGTWFALDPPLVEGAGNPPAGWENPYQPGTLTFTSPDEAVFTDDVGHDVVLRAAADSARPAPCD